MLAGDPPDHAPDQVNEGTPFARLPAVVTPDELAVRFRNFADASTARAPLYRHLSASIADDAEVAALLNAAPDEQAIPVLLFAAVHHLVLDDPGSPRAGPANADVTIVVFTDYRCGYCRKAYDEVAELVKSDGNIRFVVKEYPILGEESLVSARFAIAVRQVGGDDLYEKAHVALISLRGNPTPETLGQLAGDLGLDPAGILAKMDSDEVTAVIAANHALGEQLRINGTPTFVIDGTMVRGYVPLDGMREIVKAQREG